VEIRRAVAQREDGGWAVDGRGCPVGARYSLRLQDLAILTGGPQARRNFLDGFAQGQPAACGRPRSLSPDPGRRNYLLQRGQCEHLHP